MSSLEKNWKGGENLIIRQQKDYYSLGSICIIEKRPRGVNQEWQLFSDELLADSCAVCHVLHLTQMARSSNVYTLP